MNKTRRKKIQKAIDMLEMGDGVDQALDILEEVLYAEEDAYDNIPENLQGSWRAMDSEEAIDALNDAIDLLTDLQAAECADEDETEGKIHFIGICLLFALMIYVTFNDVIRFIIPIF